MHIGIDASRAFISRPTGTENYSLRLIKALAKIDRKNKYTLYVKNNEEDLRNVILSTSIVILNAVKNLSVNSAKDPCLAGRRVMRFFGLRPQNDRRGGFPKNFQFKVIPWPYLWTQVGLALECLLHPPDVLFIPSHTLPVLHRPGLKTVVTIHDLGAEFLPEYHQFPQKLYLNKSTEYAVKHATRLIAVSQSTKKDLIEKLGAEPKKIRVIYEGGP